jgi:hypothetical protein
VRADGSVRPGRSQASDPSAINLSVSRPFPAFSLYQSTSVPPNVGWSSLSSRVHNWAWAWDDGKPEDVLLGVQGALSGHHGQGQVPLLPRRRADDANGSALERGPAARSAA